MQFRSGLLVKANRSCPGALCSLIYIPPCQGSALSESVAAGQAPHSLSYLPAQRFPALEQASTHSSKTADRKMYVPATHPKLGKMKSESSTKNPQSSQRGHRCGDTETLRALSTIPRRAKSWVHSCVKTGAEARILKGSTGNSEREVRRLVDQLLAHSQEPYILREWPLMKKISFSYCNRRMKRSGSHCHCNT